MEERKLPYGYKMNNGKVEVDSEEAEIVKIIFDNINQYTHEHVPLMDDMKRDKDNNLYLNDKKLINEYEYVKAYVTAKINYAKMQKQQNGASKSFTDVFNEIRHEDILKHFKGRYSNLIDSVNPDVCYKFTHSGEMQF